MFIFDSPRDIFLFVYVALAPTSFRTQIPHGLTAAAPRGRSHADSHEQQRVARGRETEIRRRADFRVRKVGGSVRAARCLRPARWAPASPAASFRKPPGRARPTGPPGPPVRTRLRFRL